MDSCRTQSYFFRCSSPDASLSHQVSANDVGDCSVPSRAIHHALPTAAAASPCSPRTMDRSAPQRRHATGKPWSSSRSPPSPGGAPRYLSSQCLEHRVSCHRTPSRFEPPLPAAHAYPGRPTLFFHMAADPKVCRIDHRATASLLSRANTQRNGPFGHCRRLVYWHHPRIISENGHGRRQSIYCIPSVS